MSKNKKIKKSRFGKDKLKPSSILLFIFGIGIIAFIVNFVGFSELYSALIEIKLIYLFLFLFFITSKMLIGGFRWWILVGNLKKTKLKDIYVIFFAGIFANNLTPGPSFGGEPLKAYFLKKETKKGISPCLAVTVMDTVVDSAALFGFAVFSLWYLFMYISAPKTILFFKGGIMFVVILAVVSIYLWKVKRENLSSYFNRFLVWLYNSWILKMFRKSFEDYKEFKKYVVGKIKKFRGTAGRLAKNKKLMFETVIISMIRYIMGFLGIYALSIGLGQSISFVQAIVVGVIGGVVGYFIPLPGGTGAVEGSMIGVLVGIGVKLESATALVLIYRSFFYMITYGVGYASIVSLNNKYLKK
ncbi:MAG: lysylphosphatidylglycerol synthase transmembrane domain-containing protein [Candidatus Undinarchaeales archaeon]